MTAHGRKLSRLAYYHRVARTPEYRAKRAAYMREYRSRA